MRDSSSAVTHDCVDAENERYFYINMKLFATLYKRSEYRYMMRRGHSKFTAKRLLSYSLRYRPGLAEAHLKAINGSPTDDRLSLIN